MCRFLKDTNCRVFEAKEMLMFMFCRSKDIEEVVSDSAYDGALICL